MKAIYAVILFITVFVLFAVKAYANPNFTFTAGDESAATKLCIAAVSNDLQSSKKYINRLALSDGVTAGMYIKTKYVSNDIRCNNTDLVKFTAQYNAKDTFDFFNHRAMKKYRLSNDEVKIIDLARVDNNNSEPQVIVITSR